MTESVEVVIRQPGFPDRVVPLNEGRTRLGRADDNEIVLSDVGVSRRHAEIVLAKGDVSVEDLGSGNGTYYFGHRIKSQPIRDQDEVVIDPFILRFRVHGADGETAGPPTVPVETPDSVRLDVVVGNGIAGSTFPINDDGLTMGRAEDRDVVLPDAASSRHHCHITKEGVEFVLHDNGSANGVFVNAVRVRECTLSDGDLLRIGNTEMRFVNPHAPSETPAPWVPPGDTSPIHNPNERPHVDMALTPARTSRQREPARQSGGGGGVMRMMVAALGGVALLVILGFVAVVAAVAIALWWTAPDESVAKIPPRKPTWAITVPTNLPLTDSDTLFQEGVAATKAQEHRVALEHFYRVLNAAPENRAAKKFATFAGEVLVAGAMDADLTVAEEQRLKENKRRDQLLADLDYRRRRDKAQRALSNEFREDAKVQERMRWSMTERQRTVRERIDRLEKHVQTDEFAEATRLGRKLLEETEEPELRMKVHELLATAEEAQAKNAGKAWREGVMAEAMELNDVARQKYKAVIEIHPGNPSAKLRLDLLEEQ